MGSALYIHIPFCRQRCLYCDFYSTIHDTGLASSYIDTLAAQIQDLTGNFSTIYIGGGTPTVLERHALEKLLRNLRKFAPAASEWTVEANPESLDDDKMRLFLDSGVNRISIGVQSLHDRKLRLLGRLHNARQARDAVSRCRRHGFTNISIDLIFGMWSETLYSWEKEIKEAAELPVTHISCYSLTYEKKTPLWDAIANGSVRPLDDTVAAQMYEYAIDRLSVRGFKQYEVSNFALEGYECRHNLAYWDNDPYTGLGPSAVSYIYGTRARNVSDIHRYIDLIDEGKPAVESSETLTPVKRAKETAAVKIRTKEGIDFAGFKEKTGFDFQVLEKGVLPKLIKQDFVKYTRKADKVTGICLKRKGFLFCDSVSSALL
jgi:oxygen-independent coproporphyrinogen-3 oxidase